MLTATPGRGRITRVTIADVPGDDTLAARLVPHVNTPNPWAEDAELTNVVASVDVILPGHGGSGTTGLVATFLDADSARAFGRACYRAAVLLGQQVPASALGTVETDGAIPVEGLPDMTIAAAPVAADNPF